MADPISIDLDALPNITKFEQEKLGDKYGLLTEIADRIGSLAEGGALSPDERNVKLFQEVMNRQEGYHLPVNGDVLDLATQEAYGKAKAEYDLNGIKDIYQQQAMRDYAYGKQGIEAGLAALTTPPHELNVELTRAFQKKWNSVP